MIGMLDSIHLARWLEQFSDEEIDFTLFPSKRFRRTHCKLKSLLTDNQKSARYKLASTKFVQYSGYLDYLENEVSGLFGVHNSRSQKLTRLLTCNQFDYIHAIEIQGAGYLLSDIHSDLLKFSKIILTNWGSDIYYFKSFTNHLVKIKEILKIADYYSAECLRDYSLARELGFTGIELPCIPNAGGFDVTDLLDGSNPPSSRSQILIKGYGGRFGRADLPISLIPWISERYPSYTYLIYSVTPDILALIKELPKEIKGKIRISKVTRALPQKEMLNQFKASRIYIGCSVSDGISTSFLEALVNGAYPIQTGTSCANEWVQKGASASIVRLVPAELQAAIENSLSDDQLVDQAAIKNRLLAERELSSQVIKRQALTYYSV